MKKWISEGHFLKIYDKFYYVDAAEVGFYEYTWSKSIDANTLSDPEDIEDLKPISLDRLFQCAFGVEEGVLAYINIPADKARFGTEKKPSQDSNNRRIGWIDYNSSPYEDPSLERTEFFTQKEGSFEYPRITIYNQLARRIKPHIFFMINRMKLIQIGEEEKELLQKLHKKLIPSRPLTLEGIEYVRSGKG